jgi:prepilin-type N-terminal cleavage/methylation domain-containing protein
MNYKLRKKGFSLVEVLMASGILAVGLLMIAGTFPVGIFLTAAATEQTIAPIVADEAFAKIQLYGIETDTSALVHLSAFTDVIADFNEINKVRAMGGTNQISWTEYLYPSFGGFSNQVYHWSAICRRIADSNDSLVQVTVFVSRKTGASLQYPDPLGGTHSWPTPVKITTTPGTNMNQRWITEPYITDGCTLVAEASGNIYRVLERISTGGVIDIVLDKNWNETTNIVWVVPPPVNGGRSPVIGVYQRIIKF